MMNKFLLLIQLATVSFFMFSLPNISIAQISNTPEIAAQVKKINNDLSTDAIMATMKLYHPILQKDSASDITVINDIPYDNHDLHKLDIYSPNEVEKLPVFVFTHGGGFVGGDKRNAAQIGRWAARNNMIGVTINYRLAPEAQWPSGAQDLALALDWVKNNISTHGGDSTKIVVGGESAGSIHTADYIFREELQNKNDGVIGAILISTPSIDQTVKGELDPERDLKYFGKDGDRKKQSVVNYVEGRKIPLLIAYSEFEPTYILDQVLRLIEAVAQRDAVNGVRKLPLVVSAPGHNHISISMHIGTQDETLSNHMKEFIYWLTNK